MLLSLCVPALGACGSTDKYDWMKVGQRYTKEDFARDYKECRRDDKFEDCMRQRGWVPVNPTKADTPPPEPPQQRGRRY